MLCLSKWQRYDAWRDMTLQCHMLSTDSWHKSAIFFELLEGLCRGCLEVELDELDDCDSFYSNQHLVWVHPIANPGRCLCLWKQSCCLILVVFFSGCSFRFSSVSRQAKPFKCLGWYCENMLCETLTVLMMQILLLYGLDLYGASV